jgi:hypothetical protein
MARFQPGHLKLCTKTFNTEDTEEHRVELLFPVLTIDHAFDSISQVRDVEVDQQSDADATQAHVREKLSLMHRMNYLDAFHFNNYQILDDQIDPVSKFNVLSLVYHRQADLTGYIEAALLKFMRKTALIGTFQQARPQHGVNVHCRRDDRARNLIYPE